MPGSELGSPVFFAIAVAEPENLLEVSLNRPALSGREEPELFCSLANAPFVISQGDLPRVFSQAAEAPSVFPQAESPRVLSAGSGMCVSGRA